MKTVSWVSVVVSACGVVYGLGTGQMAIAGACALAVVNAFMPTPLSVPGEPPK